MGEADKAISYNVATSCSDSALALQAQSVRYHLQKCFEARKVNAWDTILKETQSAVTLGADSSPQVSLNGLNTSLIPLLCMSAGFIDQLLTKTIFYALQVYALQTEALLRLFRHQEAFATYEKMPKFPINWCTKLFGQARSAYLSMIGAQAYLAVGRLVKIFYLHVQVFHKSKPCPFLCLKPLEFD